MQATAFPLRPDSGPERYTILNRIGEGSFAVTYRAHDVALDRIVALKLLRPQYATDPAFLTRFTREARAAALVNHPNVVQVYDYGTRDEIPFVVLQFIPGRDLKEFIRREGPRTPEEAVRTGAQILRGLEAIHAVGLIHRDIKPQNVLLDFDLNAHVSDFGIALNPANSMLTGDGTTLGTPSYMAPEQARGETVTKAADLYAVGVMLFEMLTGRLPFNGDNPLAVMLAHVQNSPPTPSSLASQPIPPALEATILRALSKNPRDRADSALAMAQELEASLVSSRHAARAEGRIVPFPSRVGAPTIPLSSAHDPMSSTVAAHQVIPTKDDTRRRLVWLAPLGAIALILMIWGGMKALGVGDGNGDGNDTNLQVGALLTASPTEPPAGTETAASTVTVAATRPSIVLSNATKTPRPENTATLEPTSTTRPIEPTRTLTVELTETARPSETPNPTRTPRPPTVSPTDTPEPEGPPTIAPTDGDESGSNEGQGSEGEAENGESGQSGTDGQDGQSNQGQGNAGSSGSNRAPVSLSFGPESWEGGYHRGDSGFLGRPWVAIYGAQSGLGQVSLTFDLDAKPKGDATLTITGINDEWASPNPLMIEINGVTIFEGPCPFPAWDGAGNGENAVWGTVSWTIPAGVLRKGDNQLVIRNLTNSDSTGSPPYVDISTTTIDA